MKYDFDKDLAFSLGENKTFDETLIQRAIPHCVSVRKTNLDLDKQGVDYVATLDGGTEINIDAKRRRKGAVRNNEPVLAIETWSAFPRKVGWTYSRSTPVDMILYLFDPEEWNKFYLVPFQHLRMAAINNYYEWLERYGEKEQDNDRWLSKCILVPASVVLSAVADEMAGEVWQMNRT